MYAPAHQLASSSCIHYPYGNGLLGYTREIAARTEQFFCPIRHAGNILDTHSHYGRFLDYGEADNFRSCARLEQDETAPPDVSRAAPPAPPDH